MYNVGIITESEMKSKERETELKQFDQQIGYAVVDNVSELKEANAFIIEESEKITVDKVCELVLTIKKNSNSLIWVSSHETPRVNSLIYYQLGVDGIYDLELEKEGFVLQMKNALKRSFHDSEEESNVEQIGNDATEKTSMVLVPKNSSVIKDGKEEIILTRLEYRLVALLLENKANTLTYEEINEGIWGDSNKDVKDQRYKIANVIFHLRKKLETSPTSSRRIITVRSIGYKLVV